MSDESRGAGWWIASDGKWYPPESKQPLAPPPPPSTATKQRLPAWLIPNHVSGWSVAAGYLGLFTLICLGIPGPFAVATGIKGLRQIKREPGLNGKVRSWVGIVLGALGTVLIVLLVLPRVFR